MKRILSIMLTVMLVLSSFVMVSAEEPYFEQVIIVDENGASHSFGQTFEGYYEITVKFYAPEGVEAATMSALNAGETVASTELQTFTNGKWVDAKLAVEGDAFDSVVFTAQGGIFYVSYISVDVVKAKTLVYEENFEYADGAEIPAYLRYRKIYGNASDIEHPVADPKTSFTAVAGGVGDNTTGVARLDQPGYYYVKTSVTPNLPTVRYDENGTLVTDAEVYTEYTKKVSDTLTLKGYAGAEYYVIDVPSTKDADHIIAEFDVYNASTAWHETTTEYDLTKRNLIKDFLTFTVAKTASKHSQASELPVVTIGAYDFTMQNRTIEDATSAPATVHNADAKAWNKVIYEAKREMYDSDGNGSNDKWRVDFTVTYGGKTATSSVHSAYADDFSKFIFNVPNMYGGRYYIDNFKVFVVDDVEDSYVVRYSENFDDLTAGEAVSDFEYSVQTTDTTPDERFSDFTVANSTTTGVANVNASNFGRLYNASRRETDVNLKRYLDDGVTPDPNAVALTSADEPGENGYRDGDEFLSFFDAENIYLPEEGGKTRVTFKYYLTGSITRPISSSNPDNQSPRDRIVIGLSKEGTTHANQGEIPRIAMIEPTDTTLSEKLASGSPSYTTKTVKHNLGIKNWIPVTFEVISTKDETNTRAEYRYVHNMTYSSMGATASSAIEFDGYNINGIMLGMVSSYGGIGYIDDIVISSGYRDGDYDEIDKVTENVYLKRAITQTPSGEFRIEPYGTFSNDEQTIRISKGHGDTAKVQFVLALYNGDVLEDASINELDVDTINPFSLKSFTLTDLVEVPEDLTGYTYKAFLFSADEGLKPLADMIKGEAKAPVATE